MEVIAPNAAIELHDSILQGIERCDGDITLVIKAYVHRSPGRPAVDPGAGWSQLVQLRFLKGDATVNVKTFPVTILDGCLVQSDAVFCNLIPLPIQHGRKSQMQLEFANGESVLVSGEGLVELHTGQPIFIEKY